MAGVKRRKQELEQGLLPGYSGSIQDEKGRERYREKLAYLAGVDPYEVPLKEWEDNVELWPSVSYIHVGMYLLFTSSAYTQDQLMDYKNMDCYQKFTSGWVKEVYVKKGPDERMMIIGKVNHSQRLSEKPLTPWVICEASGQVRAGHCDCMAGLGETCSHVACLLWAIEAGTKKKECLTVTDKRAYWVLPGAVKKVNPARLREIKFSENPKPNSSAPHHVEIPAPSQEEFDKFLSELAKGGEKSKPAVLALVEPYASRYVPESLSDKLPPILSGMFDKAMMGKSFEEVMAGSNEVARLYKATDEQIRAAEQATRSQASSKVWFRLRSGRVTASKFKAVCATNPEKPSPRRSEAVLCTSSLGSCAGQT